MKLQPLHVRAKDMIREDEAFDEFGPYDKITFALDDSGDWWAQTYIHQPGYSETDVFAVDPELSEVLTTAYLDVTT